MGDVLDIQNTNDIVGGALWLHGDIDPSDDPFEQVVVKRLGQGITTRRSLGNIQRHLVDRS